jgi:aromatase
MPQPGTREVEHDIEVHAPAAEVYRLIADVANWPRLFPPTVHVEHAGPAEPDTGGATRERIRIWATANGEAKSWTSRRRLDPQALRIDFRQEVSAPPVAAMGGAWVIEPVSATQCRVRLLHDYRAEDGDPAKLEWIERAVDRNSRAELTALRANAELALTGAGTLLTFEDTVRINGSARDVYDFLNEAGLWAKRLPHVARAVLEEETPGLQLLEMDTRTRDGSVHTTKSVRVCFPHGRIVYKQIHVPALLRLHTGRWLLEGTSAGVDVTSRHTVVINEANIAKILGDSAGVEEAKSYVRTALSTNSLATLGHAKEYAERRG